MKGHLLLFLNNVDLLEGKWGRGISVRTWVELNPQHP